MVVVAQVESHVIADLVDDLENRMIEVFPRPEQGEGQRVVGAVGIRELVGETEQLVIATLIACCRRR